MKLKTVLAISLTINLIVFEWVVTKLVVNNQKSRNISTSQLAYWKDKVSQYEILNARGPHRILLVGDSMIDRFCVKEFLSDVEIYNRGIG